MTIARAPGDLNQRAGVAFASQRGLDCAPIGRESCQKLETELRPLIDSKRKLAGEDRILLEKRERDLGPAQAVQKALITFACGDSGQQAVEAGEVL